MRKIIEKAYVWILGRFFKTDDAQFGFKDGLIILQAILDVEQEIQKGGKFFAIMDLKKSYNKFVWLILKKKLDKLLPAHIVQQLLVFPVAVEIPTAGNNTATKATAKTGLNEGGAISAALYRVYRNDLPRRVRNRDTTDELEPLLATKLVVDDFLTAAKRRETIQIYLDECV